jgi:arylsulfatase A-like enzyme
MENTIVVFLADHGDYLTDYGLMRKGVELPECLVRIPMVWCGRGIRGGEQHHPAHVSIADVMPTLCEAAGVPMPPGVQGRSLWPLLTGGEYPREEFRSVYAEVGFGGLHYDASDRIDLSTAIMKGAPGATPTFDELNPYTQSGYMRTVRMGTWKLAYDMMGHGQLYDLAADPHELNNLYGKPDSAAQQMRLMEELLAWSVRVEDNLPQAAYKAKWPKRNWYAPYRSK